MTTRGKKYLDAAQKVERTQLYSPDEALKLAIEVSYAGFDATVEVHLRMGLDPRRSDQQIRGVVRLPYGLGKPVRGLVFAVPGTEQIAKDAGADYVISDDEGINKIMEGWTDFDISIAVPEMMPKVGRLGRVLGRRGLMPNPKTGTVVKAEDLAVAIQDAKGGRVAYRRARTGNIPCAVGKVSFPVEQLMGNLSAIMEAIRKAKPSAAKGIYLKRMTLAPTMGPGIKVDAAQGLALESAA